MNDDHPVVVTDSILSLALDKSSAARGHTLKLLDDVSERISKGIITLEDQLAVSREQKKLICHLASLRGSHRNAIHSGRDTKAQTTTARQEVDTLHLQLQNLYYEQRHLQGEIDACESYE